MTKHRDTRRRTLSPKTKISTAEELHEAIQILAYQLYCQCGYEHGHDLEHWVEAERRVLERHHATPKARG